jgi:cardiolipin synthase
MVDTDEEQVLDRVATIPNAISLLRLIVVALALVVLFAEHERVFAGVLLAIAGVTDFLDGYVARRIGQVSKIGKLLDPTVDRMVLASSILSIVIYGAVPVWVAVAVLSREVLISVMAIVIAMSAGARIDVLWLGKAGTFGFLVAFPLFLFGDGPGAFAHALHVAAYIVSVPALLASWLSIGAYVPLARKALAGQKSSREAML